MFVSLFFVEVPIQFYQKRKSTYFPKEKLKDSAYFSGFGKNVKEIIISQSYIIGRNFVSRNFHYKTKISSLSPDE